MSCKVSYCRFPMSHVTLEHLCGTCNIKGHGQVECEDTEMKSKLKHFYNDTLPISNQCTIPNCNSKTTHNNDAHHCINCNRRHNESECIIQDLDTHSNTYGLDKDTITNFITNPANQHSFITTYAGMGCNVYVRSDMMSLFMHQDSYGQYGPNCDDTPILNEFLNGYTDKTDEFVAPDYGSTDYSIKCPMCRTINTQNDILEIKGSNAKCIICDENDVEIYLSKCKHSDICSDCCNKLEKLI